MSRLGCFSARSALSALIERSSDTLMSRALYLCCTFLLSSSALSSIIYDDVYAQESQTQGASSGAPQLPTRFSARIVEWDQRAQALSAREQVTLTQGDLTVTCDVARVEFEEGRELRQSEGHSTRAPNHSLRGVLGALQLKRIHAQGEVSVRFRDLSLSASAIDYDHTSETLSVMGPISGRWGRARLRGARLTLSLATRAARAQVVEVALPLPVIIPRDPLRDITGGRAKRASGSRGAVDAWRSR